MRILVAEDYEGMSRKAAAVLAAQVIAKPESVLGLATGSSPVGMYRLLVEAYRKGDVDFSRVRSVNLDEYVGLAPDHEQSYRRFMQVNFFDHVNIDPANTFVPDGLAEDPAEACRRYDRIIRDMGGVDLQLLGIGHNGHIGFNEPGDSLEAHTHVVALQERTIDANARFFASRDQVPRQAMTMGVGAILKAKKILLVVSGADKAAAVTAAFTGPVTTRVPASLLQLHPDVTVAGDRAALSGLL